MLHSLVFVYNSVFSKGAFIWATKSQYLNLEPWLKPQKSEQRDSHNDPFLLTPKFLIIITYTLIVILFFNLNWKKKLIHQKIRLTFPLYSLFEIHFWLTLIMILVSLLFSKIDSIIMLANKRAKINLISPNQFWLSFQSVFQSF